MFHSNKYTKWYYNIVRGAKHRIIDGYIEAHHIIPRCLGGSDSGDNLVRLTPREHFICHMLLTKMHDDHRLKFAFIVMAVENPKQCRRFKISSKMYEYLKKCNSAASSVRSKGKQKHNVGKLMAYDPITQEARLFKPEESIPDGWIYGSPPRRRNNQMGKNKGKEYYYNPATHETIAITKDDIVPDGFLRGNINGVEASKKAAERNTGTILCYDPITMKACRLKVIPEGWVRGSAYVWANDGTDNKQFLKSEPLPSGWVLGRRKWR